MTYNNHPITPPPELIRKWNEDAATAPMADQRYIATQAARWGADQELEACIKLLSDLGGDGEMIRRALERLQELEVQVEAQVNG